MPSMRSVSSACSPNSSIQGRKRSLCAFTCLDNDPSLSRCPRQGLMSRLPESCQHERPHLVRPLAEVLLCTSFQNERFGPFCVDHGTTTFFAHRHQRLNQRAPFMFCCLRSSSFVLQLRIQRDKARLLRLKALKCFLHLLLCRHCESWKIR